MSDRYAAIYKRRMAETKHRLAAVKERPRANSNCALRLRRPTLCPLSYGGGRQNFITSAEVFTYRVAPARRELHKFAAQSLNDPGVASTIANFGELLLLVSEFTGALDKSCLVEPKLPGCQCVNDVAFVWKKEMRSGRIAFGEMEPFATHRAEYFSAFMSDHPDDERPA